MLVFGNGLQQERLAGFALQIDCSVIGRHTVSTPARVSARLWTHWR